MTAGNSTRVPVLPAGLDWSSAIGNFILNYGVLDWHLTVFLEARLSETEFAAVKNRHFQDRVKQIQKLIETDRLLATKQMAFGQFFARLETIRLLRNQIAHGQLAVKWTKDGKVDEIILTQFEDRDSQKRPPSRFVNFSEIIVSLKGLTDLIEDFKQLSGDWKTDEITFGPGQTDVHDRNSGD